MSLKPRRTGYSQYNVKTTTTKQQQQQKQNKNDNSLRLGPIQGSNLQFDIKKATTRKKEEKKKTITKSFKTKSVISRFDLLWIRTRSEMVTFFSMQTSVSPE